MNLRQVESGLGLAPLQPMLVGQRNHREFFVAVGHCSKSFKECRVSKRKGKIALEVKKYKLLCIK